MTKYKQYLFGRVIETCQLCVNYLTKHTGLSEEVATERVLDTVTELLNIYTFKLSVSKKSDIIKINNVISALHSTYIK